MPKSDDLQTELREPCDSGMTITAKFPSDKSPLRRFLLQMADSIAEKGRELRSPRFYLPPCRLFAFLHE